ncbi:MAG: hypothetical protein ACK5LC_12460 [Coprobacillaceae bacterium]
MKDRGKYNHIKPEQIPKRTALLLNLMIGSVMIIFALSVFFPIILKYSLFMMIGVIFVFLIVLLAGNK